MKRGSGETTMKVVVRNEKDDRIAVVNKAVAVLGVSVLIVVTAAFALL
jgi:hypothetical protein